MSAAHIWAILKKDIARAPRSGIVALAFGYPVLLTLIVQLVFGQIFDPPPRVGLHAAGESAVATAVREAPAAQLEEFADPQAMWDAVAAGDLDAGLSLPEDFDESIRRAMASPGTAPAPAFEVHLSTLSNPQARLKAESLLVAAFLELAPEPPVQIERVKLRDDAPKSWVERLLPILVLLTFFMAGTFLTGFALVDEKARGTLKAILTTPTSMLELLLAKALFSYGVAMVCGLLALLLNDALTSVTATLAVAMTLAAIMTIELGMVVGLMSKDVSALYGAVKGIGPVLAASALPYLWDGFPGWIAKLVPTWWVLAPIVDVVNQGATLPDVWVELGVAALICVALVFAVRSVSARTMARLDATH